MTSRALTVVVVIGLSGCGRVGFDDASGDGDAQAANPDAPLARWRLNEARAGRAPRELVDDTPEPVDLILSYVSSSPMWREASGGRYLDFRYTIGEMVNTGGAQAVASGTKLDQLDGSLAVTVETKHAWGACVNRDPRIVEIANGVLFTDGGWLSVRENNNSEVFAIQFEGNPTWTTYRYLIDGSSCLLDGPHVVHWVFDANAPAVQNRIRVYVDGARETVERMVGNPPELGQRLELGEGERRVGISRPFEGEREHLGSVWYAAFYNRALSDDEILRNAMNLEANDD